jgi:hypothetical protein
MRRRCRAAQALPRLSMRAVGLCHFSFFRFDQPHRRLVARSTQHIVTVIGLAHVAASSLLFVAFAALQFCKSL